jgi:hypothetical protein
MLEREIRCFDFPSQFPCPWATLFKCARKCNSQETVGRVGAQIDTIEHQPFIALAESLPLEEP